MLQIRLPALWWRRLSSAFATRFAAFVPQLPIRRAVPIIAHANTRRRPSARIGRLRHGVPWLGALALLGSAAHAQTHVATLELAAPSVDTFVLRGTVPVPPFTFPVTNGVIPLQVRDANGSLVPAQVEIVSRYPNDAEGADVVEVLANVHRPAGVQPGDRIQYDVVAQPHRRVQPDAATSVDEIFALPRGVVLRATDAFGNVYQSDLLDDVRANTPNLRVMRSGCSAQTFATYHVLMPVAPQSGSLATLPHFLGVHAYVTRWTGGDGAAFFSLDLRVSNAASGLDPADTRDDPLGDVYFGKIELRLPTGWTVINSLPDPYFAPAYDEGGRRIQPIVSELANGQRHLLPVMGQFERRLVITRPEALARAQALSREENLGFCRDGTRNDGSGVPLWSWWSRATARYFPQRRELPTLTPALATTIRNNDAGQISMRMAQIASGSSGIWPAEAPGMGWAHFWHVSDGGAVSGHEIVMFEGIETAWAASNAGYRMHQLRHRMYTDRQRNVLFDKNGQHTAVQEWVIHDAVQGDWMPIWWYNTPILTSADPFGILQSSPLQRNWVAANGLKPWYESAMRGYTPIDTAHLVRYTHDTKALVWLGNDVLSKEDLRAQAEGFRIGFTDLRQDLWGGVIPSGLLAAQNYVALFPGWGLPFGRAEGWGLDCVCAAYSTQDPSWRTLVRPWFDDVLDVVEAGQSDCNDTIQASPLYNVFNAQYRCRQAIEAAITENALVSLRSTVYGRTFPTQGARVNAIIARSCRAMISPLFWSSTGHAPWSVLAVGPFNNALPPFCTFTPPDGNGGFSDAYQCWSSFAYAYEITQDPVFLAKAQEMLQAPLSPTMENNPLENLGNKAALLTLVQHLY